MLMWNTPLIKTTLMVALHYTWSNLNNTKKKGTIMPVQE